MTRNILIAVLGLGLIGASFYALRENEARLAAETKLQNIRSNAESAVTQKDNAITELQTESSLMQQKLQDADDRYSLLEMEKQRELAEAIEKLEALKTDLSEQTARAEQLIKENEARVGEYEAKLDEAAKKQNDLLAKKNAEISEIGEQLKQASSKYADLLKEKEVYESKNGALESRVSSLERDIQRLESERSHLLEALKAGQPKVEAVASAAAQQAPPKEAPIND